MAEPAEPSDGPVTRVITRQVKPGREADFETWLADLNSAALTFPGHLGVQVLRPDPGSHAQYVIIFRFDSAANLKAWEESSVRRHWLDQGRHLSDGEPTIQNLTGLETWFTLPGRTATVLQPPRHKMAVVIVLALYPLLNALRWVLSPILAGWPVPLQLLVSVILAVPVMTYILMPLMTRLFTRWLFSSSTR